MKAIKLLQREIAAFFMICILFASCSRYDEFIIVDNNVNKVLDSQVAKGISDRGYSGKEIFSALFYMRGNLVNNIDFVKNQRNKIFSLYEGNIADLNNDLDSINQYNIDYIDTKYPYFFEEFKDKMYSDNLFLMKEAMTDATYIVKECLLTHNLTKDYIKVADDLESLPTDKLNELKKIDVRTSEGKDKLVKFLQDNDIEPVNQTTGVAFAFIIIAVFIAYFIAIAVNIAFAFWYVVTEAIWMSWDEFWGQIKKGVDFFEFVLADIRVGISIY